MVEYVSYENLSKGIKRKDEISRSNGMGWILCQKEEELQLHFIHGGYAFQEDSIYLNTRERQAYTEKGDSFLKQLYLDIVRNPKTFSDRFLEKTAPEFIYISQVERGEDKNKHLYYSFLNEPYTGSVHDSKEGIVFQEWVLKEGKIIQYIKYGKDGRPERILEGSDVILIPEEFESEM